MQVIRISQSEDREAWLESRKGIITGSKVKNIKPLTRGTDRTPAGFWELLAEQLSVEKDGEDERQRGLRLENEALEKTAEKFGLRLNLDAGMWVSDENPSMAVSPDSAEDADIITYAGEAKCLDAKNHLKYLYTDRMARKKSDYSGFSNVPKEFQDQIVQYFLINENLQTVYFTLYNDRIIYDHLTHWVIVVKRDEVLVSIEILRQVELDVLEQLEQVKKELIGAF